MQINNNEIDFSGQSIYAGIDVHKKMWKVSILTDELEHKTFTMPPEPRVLINYMERNFPKGEYKCVYEAGYSGFWICEEFRQNNIDCMVVNPSDVPSKDKEKRFKNDRIDSRKLARSLRSGELEGIYVPDRKSTEDRALLRVRHMLVKKMTRTKNQIKALLSYYGLEPQERTYWSRQYIENIEKITMAGNSGKIAVITLLDEFKQLREKILEVTGHIRTLSQTDKYKLKVLNLISIPGISTLSAMILLTELGDIGRFKSFDKLNSYVGLIPGEYSSGEREISYGIAHRGNSFVRKVLIESAWVAARRDPALLLAYKKLSGRMCKNKVIIKIARKLLNRIRYVLLNNRLYEHGIIN
jgi:transposase